MRVERVPFRSGIQMDMPLLVCVVAIATFGVVNLYSATSVFVGHPKLASIADAYVLQIYWIVIGFLFGVLAAAIDYRHFERFATLIYLGAFVLLGLVFVFGSDVRGSARWLEIGNFNVQPSEFMKLAVILMVARHIHNDVKLEPRTLGDLVLPVLYAGVPAIAVGMQPDLGTALLFILTTFTMLAITKIRRRTLLGVFGTVVGFAVVAYQSGFLEKYVLREYQADRIKSFLNPSEHQQKEAWHALQSQTAIGNGGLTGEGFMQGTQNQFGYLPDQHSDFPFAVFAEDWGFAGCLLLLALYCFLCIWVINIASQARDRFGAALAVGVGGIIFWHTIINVGMVLGLLPVVGMTLPLFSYGGSSVITTLIALGLLMNVSMRR